MYSLLYPMQIFVAEKRNILEVCLKGLNMLSINE
jgi:hypothetical protein